MIHNPKFAAVLTLEGDFVSTARAVQAAHRDQQAIISVIRERISAEQQRAESRAAELRTTISDNSRSETVRQLAAGELRELESSTYGPTQSEREAFAEVSAKAEQALRDLATTRQALHDALAAARAELETIQSETTGKIELELMRRWIDGQKKEFESL